MPQSMTVSPSPCCMLLEEIGIVPRGQAGAAAASGPFHPPTVICRSTPMAALLGYGHCGVAGGHGASGRGAFADDGTRRSAPGTGSDLRPVSRRWRRDVLPCLADPGAGAMSSAQAESAGLEFQESPCLQGSLVPAAQPVPVLRQRPHREYARRGMKCLPCCDHDPPGAGAGICRCGTLWHRAGGSG